MLSDIAIAITIKNANYRCIINNISKSEVIKSSMLEDRGYT